MADLTEDANLVFEALKAARGDHVSEVSLLAAMGEQRLCADSLDRLANATVKLRLSGVNLNYKLTRGWALIR